jgi:hypothetical protein
MQKALRNQLPGAKTAWYCRIEASDYSVENRSHCSKNRLIGQDRRPRRISALFENEIFFR